MAVNGIDVIKTLQDQSNTETSHRTVLRVGTVVSVVQQGKMTITLGADEPENAIPARHLGSYDPTPGDTVLVLVQGPDVLVIGSTQKGQDFDSEQRDFTEFPITEGELAHDAVRRQHILDREITQLKIAEQAINEELLAMEAITETKIASNAISTPKIQALAITGEKITARTIQASHIQASAITAFEIAGNTITADKVSANTLTAAEIRTDTIATDTAFINALLVGTANIINGNITTAKINDAAITTAKINDLAVTNAKIASAAITEAKIGNLQVTTAKIASAAITEAKIGNLQVTTAKIASAAITTAKIQDLAVSNAKVGNLSAAKITTGSMHGNRISAGTLNANRISGGTISASISISSPSINGGAVTGASFTTTATASRRVTIGGSATNIRFGNQSNINASGDFALTVSADPLLLNGASNLYLNATIVRSVGRFLAQDNQISARDPSATTIRVGFRAGNSGQGIEWQSRVTSSTGIVSTATYRGMAASFFRQVSAREYKKNVEDYKASVLDNILNVPVHRYRLKTAKDLNDKVLSAKVVKPKVGTEETPPYPADPEIDEAEEPDSDPMLGFMLDELPDELVHGDGYSISEALAYLWKGVQELTVEVRNNRGPHNG